MRTPKLSTYEKKLYDLLPTHGHIDSETLTMAFYGGKVPLNGRVIITGLIRRLKAKSAVVRGVRRVQSTQGSGRKSILVWTGSARLKA